MDLHSSFRFVLIILTISFPLFSSCASTQSSRFYALSVMPNSTSDTPSEATDSDITIGIGPIKIPDYLDRPQIVTRDNQNEITISEFDRWAGQLRNSVANVLSENLSTILSTDRVVLYPWRGSIPLDFQVEVEVIQFDGEPGGNVALVARWIVIKGKSKKVLTIKRSSITEAVSGKNYTAFVAAQSRSLLKLSQEMATAVKDISSNEP